MAARPKGSPTTTSKPRARPVDAAQARWKDTRNPHPDRRYSLVSQSGDAVAEYIDMGYEPCLWEIEDGVVVGAHVMSGRSSDRAHGKEIVARDCLLMWVSKERHREIQENGAYGDTGWSHSKMLEDKIINKDGYEDPMRGINRRFAYMRADPEHGEVDTFTT